MGLPTKKSSLDVHLDSDSHHHVPDSGVVLQDGDIRKVQRLVCLCITGRMRSFPTDIMEFILNLTLLHLELEAAAKGAHL